MFSGLRLIVSENALEKTDERTFPLSRNRSRRIHKKLVKRFGGEFRQVPAVFRMGNSLIMHPAMYAELKKSIP